MFYILDGKKIKHADRNEFYAWYPEANKRIALTTIKDCNISTVFLGIDHQFSLRGNLPILFETMVFGGKYDGYRQQYSTYEEAEEGHEEIIMLINDLSPNIFVDIFYKTIGNLFS